MLKILTFSTLFPNAVAPHHGIFTETGLQHSLPDTQLLVAGSGPERGRLEALARSLGVLERVRFAGVLSQDQLRTWYAAANALVLASSREGWANVLLEAMACGTPALASDVGGTAEVITCHAAGLLLPENSAFGIAHAVRALRANPPARGATQAHACRHACRHAWGDTTRAKYDLLARIGGHQLSPAEPCILQINCST